MKKQSTIPEPKKIILKTNPEVKKSSSKDSIASKFQGLKFNSINHI